jgi:hypothetical protein
MSPSYHVRYSLSRAGIVRSPADVQSIDVAVELEQIPAQLPEGAYIMYIEDVNDKRAVHWTRWPASFRPGFGK